MRRPREFDPRFVAFQDTLNRTLNKTVSHARLTMAFVDGADPTRAMVASLRHTGAGVALSSVPLGNGHYLSIRMVVRLTPAGVTTDQTSIACRCSEELRSDDWIFRYEYEPLMAARTDYPYPVAHLHVNAEPAHYRGNKPFPELILPTRRLSLEEIIRHLVVEHDVPTLGERGEALAFLAAQQADFEQRRTDPERRLHPEPGTPPAGQGRDATKRRRRRS